MPTDLEPRDVIQCNNGEIEFLRASFGLCDDIKAPVLRCDPIHADGELVNAALLHGKIAVVERGSSTGASCSFVDKAKKVISAGAVAMVVVNSEDTLIAPGDSSREGNAVMLPVVGIRRSDAARLLDGEEASISYQPIVHLTNEQRKHLRAVVIMRNKDGALATMKLDQGVASEFLLDEIEEMLSRDELVRVQLEDDDELAANEPVQLADIEDMVDLSTVLAENLGATVVQITARQFVLYRGRRGEGAIELPKEGETSILVAELSVSLGQLSDSIQVLLSDDTSVFDQMSASQEHLVVEVPAPVDGME